MPNTILSLSEKPHHDTISMKGLITMHHNTITISKPHSILMNFVDFIKTGLPVKIPNITALLNSSFCQHFNKHFCKVEVYFVLIFVNLDRKKPQNGITERENQKLSTVEETTGDSYW